MPVYSVDDEKTAKLLLATCCKLGHDGEYYAEELFDSYGQPHEGAERIDGFVRFGKKLEAVDQRRCRLAAY